MLPPQPVFERLLLGLGNPGGRYADNRHNAGFMVLDRLASRCGAGRWRRACRSFIAEGVLQKHTLLLAKPRTFMNRSGAAVQALLDRFDVDVADLLVVHDDLDLPFGRLRIRQGGGHGGHKGIRSILDVVGSGDFLRLKVGIGRPSGKGDVSDYVLSDFDADERVVIPDLLDRAAEAIESIVLEGPVRAMNRFHT